MVFADGGVGRQKLALRTAEAIVFFLVYQLTFQVLATSRPAAPERNVGLDSLLLKIPNDRRRAVTPIGRCLANVNPMARMTAGAVPDTADGRVPRPS